MSIDLKQKQKDLENNLSIIFSSNLTLSNLKNESFAKIIEKQLNILGFISRKNNEPSKKIDSFIKKYNEETKSKFEIDKNFNYSDLDLMVDDINYLNIYCQNIFKLSLDEISKGKQQKIEKVSTDRTKVINAQDNIWSSNNTFMNVGAQPMDPHMNPLLIGQAHARLKDEMNNGNVYIYNKKPRIIPILKIIISSLFLLLALSQVLLVVFMSLSGNFEYRTVDGTINFPTSQIIWSSIMDVLFACIFIWASWFFIKPMLLLKDKKNNTIKPKNDNNIYYFVWQPFIFIGIFYVLIILMDIFWFPGTTQTIFSVLSESKEIVSNANVIYALDGWYYMVIVELVCLSLILLLLVMASISNPKQDKDKVKNLINQYINDLVGQSSNAN